MARRSLEDFPPGFPFQSHLEAVMLRVGGGRKKIGQSRGKQEKRGRELHLLPGDVPGPEGRLTASFASSRGSCLFLQRPGRNGGVVSASSQVSNPVAGQRQSVGRLKGLRLCVAFLSVARRAAEA